MAVRFRSSADLPNVTKIFVAASPSILNFKVELDGNSAPKQSEKDAFFGGKDCSSQSLFSVYFILRLQGKKNLRVVIGKRRTLSQGKEQEEEKTLLNNAIELVSGRGPQSRTPLVRPAVFALPASQSCLLMSELAISLSH